MSKTLDAEILGTRAGFTGKPALLNLEAVKSNGLELSEIVFKALDFFIPNPDNHVFESLKDEAYFSALRKDIESAGAILNPLITMPNGLVVEGHSRLIIAKKMAEAGSALGKLPVRIILSPLTDEEIRQRVYLGNLSRFEIDENTRIHLYAQIWPEYFNTVQTAGRKSDRGDTITIKDISEQTGKSVPQIKRDAKIFRKALEISEGTPGVDHIKKARTAINESRRKKQKPADLRERYMMEIKQTISALENENCPEAEALIRGINIATEIFQRLYGLENDESGLVPGRT